MLFCGSGSRLVAEGSFAALIRGFHKEPVQKAELREWIQGESQGEVLLH